MRLEDPHFIYLLLGSKESGGPCFRINSRDLTHIYRRYQRIMRLTATLSVFREHELRNFHASHLQLSSESILRQANRVGSVLETGCPSFREAKKVGLRDGYAACERLVRVSDGSYERV